VTTGFRKDEFPHQAGDSVGNLTPIALNDDVYFPSDRASSTIFTPIARITYRISVYSYDGNHSNIELNVMFQNLALFVDWIRYYFTHYPPESKTPMADPEGDSFINFFEFAPSA